MDEWKSEIWFDKRYSKPGKIDLVFDIGFWGALSVVGFLAGLYVGSLIF